MPTKSRKFRVATEGATTDGRTIQREWLVQAAKNYDPKTFTAHVNIEHIRSAYPDSTFRNYGKITAVEAKEEDGKMRLYAEIEPLPDLVTATQAGQKLFTSIEINPKFADTDQAYLVGVAVMDNPVSLGSPRHLLHRRSAPKGRDPVPPPMGPSCPSVAPLMAPCFGACPFTTAHLHP